MKKSIFLSFVLLFLLVELNAQTDRTLRLGVEASPTFSWMRTDNNLIVGDGTNGGLNLGVIVEYYFAPNYALATGISFAMNQGGGLNYGFSGNFWPRTASNNDNLPNAYDLNTIDEGSTLTYHLQYIEIPIGLKLKTSEIGHLRYFANLPIISLNFLTNARGDVTLADNTLTENETISSDVVGFGATIGGGVGAEYNLTQNVTAVGGIYFNSSLIDLTRNANTAILPGGQLEDSKASANRIMIKLGILF